VHWLAIHLPHLPLEVFPGDAAVPFAVVTDERPPRILAADRAARGAGVRPGMRLAAAGALAPGLAARARDGGAEAGALMGLAAWAMGFTPVVSPEPPDGLLLEVGGSLGLFGGIEALSARVRRGLRARGHTPRLGAAPTARAAWLLARAGNAAPVADFGALPARLAVLPIGTLDVPPGTLADLERVGLATLGDLMALPRAGIQVRFGPAPLLVLDRALGRLPEPRTPFVPPDAFAAHLPLPAETADLGALRFGLGRLVRGLADFLAARGAAVDALTLHLVPDGAPSRTMPLTLSAPTRDRDLLLHVLMTRLERVALARPVAALRLEAARTVPLAARDRPLFAGRETHAEGFSALLERLRARLGAKAVAALATAPDHRPERAWALCPPGEQGPEPDPAPRPLWLLEPPHALPVVEGRPYLGSPLTLAAGPERIEGGWWDGHDVARDYYRAEDGAGGHHWVFRDRKGPGWFRHGLFA